jgi:hypothetical protein
MTMRWKSRGRIMSALILGAMLVFSPAAAHKEHKEKHPEAMQVVASPSPAVSTANESRPQAIAAVSAALLLRACC